MRTPPIRRRFTSYALGGFALVLLSFAIFLYFSLQTRLEDAAADLLRNRAELVRELGADTPPEEIAAELTEAGVPALVRTPQGERFESDPRTPRFGSTPPGPFSTLEPPLVSRTVALPNGTLVEVFASRAGVQATLRRLLITVGIGSAAALLLTWALIRWLVRATLDPLETVVETAESIAAGRIGERLYPDRPGTELGRMATSFDDMLDALEGAIERAWAEEEKSRRFLGDAAHQLRTPLSGVRAAAELLLTETDPETRDRLLAHLVRETARTSNLISDLLHVARLDQARPPLTEPTDLVGLVRDEVERARDQAPHLEIDLHVESEPSRPAHVEPGEVRSAIANLLANARRHGEARVEVTVSTDGERVVTRVRDDGPGIPPGSEEVVFERFSTLDGRGGSGLGLPIVRGVAQAHGGYAYHDGRGFVVELPLGAPQQDLDEVPAISG